MSTALPLQHPPGTVERVDTIADLAAVAAPDVSTCIWRRTPSAGALAYAGAVRHQPLSLTTVIPAGQAATLAGQLPALPGLEAFVDDLRQLCELFETLLEPSALGVRVQSLDAPMCPRFHVDHVALRLVCTYVGAGTEILDDPGADRGLLGAGARGLADEVSGLLRRPAAIVAVEPGHVALLKGERWPGNANRGVIHRSPHGAGSRLLLSLDALEDA